MQILGTLQKKSKFKRVELQGKGQPGTSPEGVTKKCIHCGTIHIWIWKGNVSVGGIPEMAVSSSLSHGQCSYLKGKLLLYFFSSSYAQNSS